MALDREIAVARAGGASASKSVVKAGVPVSAAVRPHLCVVAYVSVFCGHAERSSVMSHGSHGPSSCITTCLVPHAPFYVLL
jgi:hypothetical protein